MKWIFYDSVDTSLYIPRCKCDAAANTALGAAAGTAIAPGVGTIIGAGIGAAASIVGNLIGSSNTKKTNNTNMQINRENIAAQKGLMNTQMAFSREMYARQYNDTLPKNVRRQYEAAGLNPYMMMSQGNGAVASTPSAPSSSIPTSIPMQAYHPDFSGVADSISNIFVNDKLKADTEAVRIDNLTRLQTNKTKILEMLSHVGKNSFEAAYLWKQLELLDRTMDSLINQESGKARLIKTQSDQADWDLFWNMYKSTYDEYLMRANIRLSKAQSASLEAGLREVYARCRQISEETKLTKQTVNKVIEENKQLKLLTQHNQKLYPLLRNEIRSTIMKNLRAPNLKVGILGTGIDFPAHLNGPDSQFYGDFLSPRPDKIPSGNKHRK